MKHQSLKTIIALLGAAMLFTACGKNYDENILGQWKFVQLEYDEQNLVDSTIHVHRTTTSASMRDLEFKSNHTMTLEGYVNDDCWGTGDGVDTYWTYEKGWSMSPNNDTVYIEPINSMDASKTYVWEIVELNKTSFVFIERFRTEYRDTWYKYTYSRI